MKLVAAPSIKPVVRIGSTRADLASFPEDVKGVQLENIALWHISWNLNSVRTNCCLYTRLSINLLRNGRGERI